MAFDFGKFGLPSPFHTIGTGGASGASGGGGDRELDELADELDQLTIDEIANANVAQEAQARVAAHRLADEVTEEDANKFYGTLDKLWGDVDPKRK